MIVKKCIILITLLACILGVAIVSAAAKPVSSTAPSGDGSGYVVKPVKSSETVVLETVSSTISQGNTNMHYRTISSYVTTLNVNLNWGNTGNSLQLTIYSPDNHVFGPYYDKDDGVIDGRINLDIINNNGIAQGQWTYMVYGYSVVGTQSYTI